MRKIIIIGLLLFSPQLFAGSDIQVSTWYGLIPALLAIVLAILSKQVIISLLVGVASGAFIHSFSESSDSYCFGIDKVFDHYLVNALADSGHASVVIFSLLIAASIHLMAKMGAFNGLVLWLSKYAKSKRSALVITYIMGFFVFFDDYANTLVVGNTMQKITDKFKISREKLAFIVDATAAPIASIALVSTWIGYEVQLIDDGLGEHSIPGVSSGYSVFLNAIQYSFYPIMILIFILVLVMTGKDFGPMLKFENNPSTILITKDENEKVTHPLLAIIPIVVLLFVTLFGIYITGYDNNGIVEAIQNGDCYKGLLWGSSACFVLVFGISLYLKNKVEDNINWMFDGMKSLFPALVVLILAWSLNNVLQDLELGSYLGGLIQSSNIAFVYIPAIVFVLSGVIAFSTGSSFSTMGILVPIVIAICHDGIIAGESLSVLYISIASVLSGAVLGDHCSPISDTTILSSMATGCDHINHVNSQLTYCLMCGGIALLLILLNSSIHLNIVPTYIIGVILIYLIISVLGKKTN